MPGDCNVTKLEREDWQMFAGFAKLGWDRFLGYHKTFVRQVLAGQWDVGPAPSV